ncbi:hypothetical protein [Modicisalibacter luteus]|uniref:hypothetical protein n=1 Tax=Modicisalibacter luteus TaxID=453962 RepID=UPI0036280784
MKRIFSVASTALVLSMSGSVLAEGPRVLDVASTFPKGAPYLGEGAENLAKLLEKATKGEIKLRVHGDGDLVPALEVFNAVSSGAVPAGWDWVGYWAGTVPVAGLAGAMPFGPSPEVFLGWMWEGGDWKSCKKHTTNIM